MKTPTWLYPLAFCLFFIGCVVTAYGGAMAFFYQMSQLAPHTDYSAVLISGLGDILWGIGLLIMLWKREEWLKEIE